jgi:redox-sensitive bicupin YhaK (pirin superfamily)
VIAVRREAERGRFDYGWLDTRHTFSFGDYHDPAQVGFRALRVLNEDRLRPGGGFPTHAHRDMEIVTWVLAGALAHRDSLGHGSIVGAGDLQRMTAGTGVTHSEYNAAADEPVHFLQIWILPAARGLAPGYEQRAFPAAERRGRLRLVASGDGREGSVTVHQDADLLAALLAPGEAVTHPLRPGRHAWLQVAAGSVTVHGVALGAGDGAAVSGERALTVRGTAPCEVLVIDLA